MVPSLLVQTLTERLHREISIKTIFILFGRQNTNYSETEAGLKQENVPNVRIIKTVWEVDFITGMVTERMYLFAITNE